MSCDALESLFDCVQISVGFWREKQWVRLKLIGVKKQLERRSVIEENIEIKMDGIWLYPHLGPTSWYES